LFSVVFAVLGFWWRESDCCGTPYSSRY